MSAEDVIKVIDHVVWLALLVVIGLWFVGAFDKDGT